jgi:serine protease
VEDAVQDAECACTTAVCGAGMLNAAAAVSEALRPTAIAQATGVVGPARILTLDGSGSRAAVGRILTSYRWTVAGTTGGAATPALASASQAIATVESPLQGSYTLRLAVTDNLGATDSAEVTVTALPGGGASQGTNPPPATATRGGGGGTSPFTLLLLAALLGSVWHRRFHASR